MGGLGRLVGWLVGRASERASEQERPLVKVPFTLMTKNRANRTSLNGTDEWLWKQHLICIEGASLSTLAESASSLARSLSFPRFFVRVHPLCSSAAVLLAVLSFHPPFKRALSFIYRFDRIFYSDCTTLAQNGESLYDCQSPTIVTG